MRLLAAVALVSAAVLGFAGLGLGGDADDVPVRVHREFLVDDSESLDTARDQGRIALFYLFQNSTQFGRDLSRVDLFYRLGVRSTQLTYNHQNWVGANRPPVASQPIEWVSVSPGPHSTS